MVVARFWHLARVVENTVLSWEFKEWAVIAAFLVLFGCFCLKGFGSRKDY